MPTTDLSPTELSPAPTELSPADYVGRPLPPATIVVERGPVARFAVAVKDDSEVYARPDAAADAGFEAIPAPPTFSFAMGLLGRFAELQTEPPADAVELAALISQLRRDGGMIMHAEQEFVYHAPLLVGETVHTNARIEDVTVKAGKEGKEGKEGKTLTFLKIRTDVTNDRGEPLVSEIMTLLHRS